MPEKISNILISTIIIPALIIISALLSGASAGESAEYMFILKNGSTIAAAVDEKTLSDDGVRVIKFRTAYGELEVPRDEIIKYYKSSEETKPPVEDKAKPAPEPAAAEIKPEPAPAAVQVPKDVKEKTPAAPKEIDPMDMTAEVEKPDDTAEVQESVMKIEEIEEGVITAPKDAKPPTDKADGLLNLDDDKLLDMLGDSEVKPPQPVIDSDVEKIEEIEKVKEKYQAKKGEVKKLIPDNLNSIESDIKELAQSSTEEDWLVAKFTKEIQIEKSGTVPVEIVEVGEKKDGKADKKIAAGGEGAKKSKGTREVSLAGTNEVVISETIEAEVIGRDKLSEKIGKEFKKHKALPTKKVNEKKHLNAEIEKHFSVKDDSDAPQETKEVKVNKSGK
jgi:hypothetical protein